MLWIKAFHIIFMVTWFCGLFYLPRLYVYHAEAKDDTSIQRFKIMERKLYFGITTPGGLFTILFGFWYFSFNSGAYLHAPWFHFKMFLVVLLVIYHIYLGKLYFAFKNDRNQHGSLFYRIINEIPLVFLIGIVLAVVLKPIL